MPKISVILPVFNSQKYIRKTVQSVLNQGFADFELIIVNDGSTDDTVNILNSFSDSRINIINQSNMGPEAARNNALDVARGTTLCFSTPMTGIPRTVLKPHTVKSPDMMLT